MGVQDRDYMGRDRDSFDLRPRSAGSAPKLWLYGLMVTALALWLAPLHWFPPNWVPLIQKLRAPREFFPHQALSRGQGDGARPQPQSFSAPQQAPAPAAPPTRRCLVNGVVVDVLNAECPPSAPALNLATSTRPIEQPPRTQPADPLVKPGTIYRCKNYSGGMFWSQAHCAKHNALVDRIAPVPVGLPFQQQVDIASGEAREIESQLTRERRENDRLSYCAALQIERNRIWKRSGAGSGYVPLDQLGADQTRWRQIERQMSANDCPR